MSRAITFNDLVLFGGVVSLIIVVTIIIIVIGVNYGWWN